MSLSEMREKQMRNPERIPRVLKLIEEIWKLQPDARFLQMIHNLTVIYSEQNNNVLNKTVYEKEESTYITSYRLDETVDGFYLEDREFEKFLEEYLNEIK